MNAISRPPQLPTSGGELEARLDVHLEPDLLERALTHRSYAYENGGLPTNERLEFLGDSVLGAQIGVAEPLTQVVVALVGDDALVGLLAAHARAVRLGQRTWRRSARAPY